MIYFVLMYR